MNEDTHIRIKQLAEQVKCQQAWQTGPAKKGKKVADASGAKASTEAKGVSTEKPIPTETRGLLAATTSGLPTATTSGLPATISGLQTSSTSL